MNLQKWRLTITLSLVSASLLLIVTCFWQVVCICGVFVCGLVLGRSICSVNCMLPNILLSHVRSHKVQRQTDDLKLVKKICPVCGNAECKRHRELNVLALKPWINLELPESVDTALTDFLNQVLDKFVYSWYSELSQDEAFVDEIRSSLRFIASVLLRRIQQVDIPTFVTEKVLNTAMRHLHMCLLATRESTSQRASLAMLSGKNVEQMVLDYYGSSLHCALHSRRSELEYMRRLTQLIFPHVLPPRSVQCRSLCSLLREILSGSVLLPAMDVLADPDKVNLLLLLFFDKSRTDYSHAPVSPLVPMLETFSRPQRKHSAIGSTLQLSDILPDQDVLFNFMKFMKAEASVNVLQFYLSIEEFNNKLLTPELSAAQLIELHKQLSDLYRMYIDPASVDCIRLDDDIIAQLKTIRDGTPGDVIKLQTSTPLFRAHEHVCGLLEHTFIPLFLQSDIYYTMVCGERLPTKPQPGSARSASKRTGEMLTLSRIGNRIKGVFRTAAVEGQFVRDDIDYEAIDSDVAIEKPEALPITCNTENAMDDLDDDQSDELSADKLCDLSAWRVSIPKIRAKPELDNPRKHVFVFCIEVHRVDITEDELESSNWMLERRYHEFYVLDQKLQEFHGELEDAQLPSKKTFLPKTISFFDTQREIFESYLQKLLSKPVLRGSELLRRFLTSEEEFTTSFLDVNLGKKMKSSAMRLVKERGQNLDPFLKSFLISTETSKPKPDRSAVERDADCISISSEKLSKTIYCNNANIEVSDLLPAAASRRAASLPDGAVENLSSIYDSIIYIALHIFDAPQWFMQTMLTVRVLIRNSVDTYLDWYLGTKLDMLMNEHRVVHIIHLLQDALFVNRDPPRTDDDKRIRCEKTLMELKDFIPKLFVQVIGDQKHSDGTKLLFDFLQQPRLNKQLSYMLLDQVIMEVFPELSATSD